MLTCLYDSFPISFWYKIEIVKTSMPTLGTVSDQGWAMFLMNDRRGLLHNLSCRVALLHDQHAVGRNIREAEVLCL